MMGRELVLNEDLGGSGMHAPRFTVLSRDQIYVMWTTWKYILRRDDEMRKRFKFICVIISTCSLAKEYGVLKYNLMRSELNSCLQHNIWLWIILSVPREPILPH